MYVCIFVAPLTQGQHTLNHTKRKKNGLRRASSFSPADLLAKTFCGGAEKALPGRILQYFILSTWLRGASAKYKTPVRLFGEPPKRRTLMMPRHACTKWGAEKFFPPPTKQ